MVPRIFFFFHCFLVLSHRNISYKLIAYCLCIFNIYAYAVALTEAVSSLFFSVER